MKAFPLILFMSLLAVFCHAQKFHALKFDEFAINEIDNYWPYEQIDISKRIKRLQDQVRKMRGVRSLLFHITREKLMTALDD
jgi:hypothetical protein